MTIAQQDIADLYARLVTELTALQPLSAWQVKPQALRSTSHKTKYGMADADGVVYINRAFVGTRAWRLLELTIRHELAHLCVGLQHGHDRHFKAMSCLFAADFGPEIKTEADEVHAAIGYKYLLYAQLANQPDLLFRRAHRKHPKYLNYKPGRLRYLTIRGAKVQGFYYVEVGV